MEDHENYYGNVWADWFEKNQHMTATEFAEQLHEYNNCLETRKNEFLDKLSQINTALKEGPLKLWLTLP